MDKLDPLLIVFIFSSINWLLTALGASLVFFVKKQNNKLVSCALGSAAGIMVAASFFSLLLPAMDILSNQPKLYNLLIPLGFILGVAFLRLSDRLIPHEHAISHNKEGLKSSYSKNKLIFLAMTMHNIPEGLAVGVAFAGVANGNFLPAIILSIGIGIQNIPEGSAIALPMYYDNNTKLKSFFFGNISAIVEVPAALIGFIFASLVNNILPVALSFAAGAMIFVCIEELIPEASATSEVDIGSISFTIGFIIMMTLDILLS